MIKIYARPEGVPTPIILEQIIYVVALTGTAQSEQSERRFCEGEMDYRGGV